MRLVVVLYDQTPGSSPRHDIIVDEQLARHLNHPRNLNLTTTHLTLLTNSLVPHFSHTLTYEQQLKQYYNNMESIRNAATAAANLVGLGGNTEENRGKQSNLC